MFKNAEGRSVESQAKNAYRFSTGVIVMSGLMRVAFSSTPTSKLEELFTNIYNAAVKEQ